MYWCVKEGNKKKKVWNNNFFPTNKKFLGAAGSRLNWERLDLFLGIHTEFQIIALFLCQVGCQELTGIRDEMFRIRIFLRCV